MIIAGGGTGGHVFPAIAIANQLRDRHEQMEILFVGANGKLEMTKVPEAGYEIIGLNISGFQRSFSLRNLMFPFKVLISLIRSFAILTRFKPDVAIGVGGYASGPLLYMAALRGIPTLIQEQNSYPGITNKLLSKRAQRICVAYDGMDRFFDSRKIIKTGNPVRKAISSAPLDPSKAKALLGLDATKPLILAIGGSLGARTINESLINGMDRIYNNHYQLLWQCGHLYYEDISRRINQSAHPNVMLTQFIGKMEVAYAAADIIISRAGALSISELCLVGKPVILVPSPNVSEDHQTKNAQALANNNAAVMVTDNDARERLVDEAILLLQDGQRQRDLSANIIGMGMTHATEDIAGEIENLIGLNQ